MTRFSKTLVILFVILCLTNFQTLRISTVSAADGAQQLVDRVIAVVNDEPITQSELEQVFIPIHEQLAQAYQGYELTQKMNETRQKLLNQLIEDHLVLQQAKKLGVDVSERDVEERLEEFKKQMPQGQDFNQLAKAQGVNVKGLRKRIRDQLAIQRLHFMEVQRKVLVSPAEVEQYYHEHENDFIDREKIKVWGITIEKGREAIQKGAVDEAAKKRIEKVLKELQKGKDFSEMARMESQDAHAKDGGLIGSVARGDMIEKIDQVLFALPDNQISEILETERAYHIFKVAERTPSQKISLEETREQIQSLLYRQKANVRFEAWMEELKRSAFISIR